MIKPLVPILFILLLLDSSLKSQDSIPKDSYRPKIGLVLSGGGAKGMAHIGALKVLEELGIKPDYITGTSMGSIMGGLYSIGYKANELDSIIRTIDWSKMLSDQIPLSNVVPEEKYYYRRYLFEFDLTKKGPVLPSGVVIGQGISEEMNYLTWHVAGVNKFDDFPTPFRCVASDLISGEPYIFDSGNLATAMRASMAIPSAFSPILLDSMLLVDGGVLNNMPIKTCRDLGADIIIAVNVGVKEHPKIEDFKTIGDILMGSAMIRSNYETKQSAEFVDIMIEPALDDYTSASFFNGNEIIELGEIAAREKYVELSELADFINQFPKDKEIDLETNIQQLYIEDIKVVGLKRLNKQFVLGKFGLEKNHTYTKKDINEGLHLLMGTRYIDNVNYELALGQHGYIITLKPVEAFPSKYNFSIHYDNVYKASAIFNIAMRNYIIRGSSFKFSGEVSEYPQINTEYIDYFGHKQKTGGYASAHWELSPVPYIKDNGEEVGEFNQHTTLLEGGILVSPNVKRMIKFGAFYKRLTSNSSGGIIDILIDDVDKVGNQYWGLNLKYFKNSLNSQFFATTGNTFNVDIEYPFGFSSIYKGSAESKELLADYIESPNESYLKLFVSFKHHLPISSKLNFSYYASIGGATKDMSSTQYFTFGGLESIKRYQDTPFVGLTTREISAQQFIMGSLNFRYEALNNLYVKLSGNIIDYKTNYDDLSFGALNTLGADDVVLGGGITISYQSIIGPIEVGYGKNTMHNKNRWYFTAGFPF